MKKKVPWKSPKTIKWCTWHFGAPCPGQEFLKSSQMRYCWIRLERTNRMPFYSDMWAKYFRKKMYLDTFFSGNIWPTYHCKTAFDSSFQDESNNTSFDYFLKILGPGRGRQSATYIILLFLAIFKGLFFSFWLIYI